MKVYMFHDDLKLLKSFLTHQLNKFLEVYASVPVCVSRVH